MDFITDNLLLVGLFFIIALLGANEARDIWISLDNSRIRVFLRYRDGQIRKFVVKKSLEKSGERFTIGKRSYHVHPDAVYRIGMFRVPTAYYNAEYSSPIMFQKQEQGKHSTDYADSTEHHVIEGLLRAFMPPKISPEMSLMIVGLLVIAAVGYVWWDITQDIDLIKKALEIGPSGNAGATKSN